MFFFYISVLSWLGRRPIGDWSATSRGPVPDRSAISCIKSQRGPHEVADQSPTSRRSVGNQSPISRRPVADQLQNLVATPLRPLRSFWILVAERSQSGCSVCLTWALVRWKVALHLPVVFVLSYIKFIVIYCNSDYLFIQILDCNVQCNAQTERRRTGKCVNLRQ